MINVNHRISKRVIGVALILVSTLIVLGYSTIGNLQPANAVVSLQPPPTGNQPRVVDLKHAPHGTAQLIWDAKLLTLDVSIHMGGLTPSMPSANNSHPADIDKGSCETTNGGLVSTLNPVVPMTNQTGGQSSSNPAGSVTNLSNVSPPNPTGGQSSTSSKPDGRRIFEDSTSKTTIPLTTGIPKSGWFINVHNGPTDPTPISCGDIINFDPSLATNQFVDVTLGPSNNPNQAANGLATLSVANNQLTVTIIMSGLAPGSTHQAHIHQGSCTSQGPVLFPLNPVIADKNGTGTSTKIIANVASIPPRGWYVNVHLGAQPQDLNTPTGFDPLVCGDV